jgi:hypothetical protein
MSANHWQALGSSEAKPLPIGCGIKSYYASGSCARLQQAMNLCASFAKVNHPPRDQGELMQYCRLLKPALAELHNVGASYVGSMQNLSR